METNIKIRKNWLKGMYLYTAFGSGITGLGILIMPKTTASVWNLPIQEPIIFGIAGSVFLAFSLISIFGLVNPLKFASVLLLQMFYKIIWFIGLIFPLLIKGQLPEYALIIIIIFATYIIGDVIAIPFKYLLRK